MEHRKIDLQRDMATGERRNKTTETALIVVLVAIFAVLCYPLLRTHTSATVLAAPTSTLDADRSIDRNVDRAGIQAPRDLEVMRLEPDATAASMRQAPSALVADVLAIIREAKFSANKYSKGRVSAGDIKVAVHARDLNTGQVVLGIEDDLALPPASGMKLVTTAAALVLLGSDWHFETGFDFAGSLQGGALQGDLIVRAGGDPLYAGDDSRLVDARLDKVVEALSLRGLSEIRGDLVLDLSSFADPEPGPEWPDSSQYWQEHCALAGGLTANGGVLAARVRATSVGQKANIEVWPAAHGLERRYSTMTVKQKVNDVRVGATQTAVTVAGKIGASVGTVEAQFAHPDPIELFASSLRAALERGGIALRGVTRRERLAPSAKRMFTLRSSLRSTLIPINAHSVNAVADQVFFATARAVMDSGTRAAGSQATGLALEQLGVSNKGFVQVDGSGLSRANRVSAQQMTTLLAAVFVSDDDTREAFMASLAVAGQSGTLENRMRGGPADGRVHAKTGWISGVSSLSGFANADNGSEWAFSILVEYPEKESGLNKHCFKPMHDAIAERLITGAGL
ncbi:MAG: D-alanyl-D-alanine carboxypeptidase/D-alanyl-D-alanine-endopeptidase (penicillin-binding protein 4) [Planctomycetota bacterium]